MGLCEKKKEKDKSPAILRDSRQVRRGGRQELQQLDARNLPAVGRQEPRSERLVKDLSIPLRLCALPDAVGLCENKKEKK